MTLAFNDILRLTLLDQARQSTCSRSRCGSIIISNNSIIGKGYNSKPCNVVGECTKDNLPENFKSDKTCCVHAEQRAIMDALKNYSTLIPGSTLYFLRFDDNLNPIPAGAPYCTICSKMALDVGIKYFALMHKDGWALYPTDEYNDLSFEFKP